MQKAVRNRNSVFSVSYDEQGNMRPTGNEQSPNQNLNMRQNSGQNSDLNYCALPSQEDDVKREIDQLLNEYSKLKARLETVHHRLHQLGFRG